MRAIDDRYNEELAPVSFTRIRSGKHRVYTLTWQSRGVCHVYRFSSYFKHLTMVGVLMRQDMHHGIVSQSQLEFALSILPPKIRKAIGELNA